jgi:DNA polymerase-3 subunit epsilon
MSGQKKVDRRLWLLLGAAAVLSVVWLLATGGLLVSTLDESVRAGVWAALQGPLPLVLLTWGGGMAAIAWGLKRWFDHWVTPSVQLAEELHSKLQEEGIHPSSLAFNYFVQSAAHFK